MRGGFPRPALLHLSGCLSRLGAATASRGRAAGHVAGTVVAEIGGTRTASRVGERHSQRRAATLADLFIALVTHQNGFPGQ